MTSRGGGFRGGNFRGGRDRGEGGYRREGEYRKEGGYRQENRFKDREENKSGKPGFGNKIRSDLLNININSRIDSRTSGSQVMIKNLSWSVTWHQLKDDFREFGNVLRADVPLDHAVLHINYFLYIFKLLGATSRIWLCGIRKAVRSRVSYR